MIQYRYDQLQFSTELPNFINIGTPTLSLPISGTIANGSGQNFSVNGNINTFSTFNDFKVTNQTLGQATYLTNNNAVNTIYQRVSTELVQNELTIIGTLVTFTITINNFTGGNITLHPQTFLLEIVEYQLPF